MARLTDERISAASTGATYEQPAYLAQVLNKAATAYKVDTDAIALKVKQEFAVKEKAWNTKITVTKGKTKAVKKAKAA